jgi:hypothetical protein
MPNFLLLGTDPDVVEPYDDLHSLNLYESTGAYCTLQEPVA